MEGGNDPMGVNPSNICFSWRLKAARNDKIRTDYELRLIGPGDDDSVVWQTDRVSSPVSYRVNYTGAALRSLTTYKWQVRIWDALGNTSGWSKQMSFITCMKASGDWQASWIKPWLVAYYFSGQDDTAKISCMKRSII